MKITSQLKRLIIGLIAKKNVTHFISGVAFGVDTWAAKIKKEYPNITLGVAIPCCSQADRWNSKSQERYNRLLSLCDKVTLVQEQYTVDCMMKRNKYMVDNSDYVIDVWNGRPSGMGNTVKDAMNKNKEVYYIDTLTFHMEKA